MNNVFHILQFAGGTFPGGGFSQSWGLETYVEKGVVRDINTLKLFLTTYLDAVIARLEGPIMAHAMQAYSNKDNDRLDEIEELSVATKLARESKEASIRMGNAFLRIANSSLNNEVITNLYNHFKNKGVTYPMAYGIVMAHLKTPCDQAMAAYVFNSVNAIVQCAVKLIPLGNSEAQRVILQMQGGMEVAAKTALTLPLDEISTFCPGLDIAGMNHESLPVRLYMT